MSGGGGRGFGRGGASNRGGGKKRTASNEGGAPARKAPKCGLCGVEGKRIYFDTKKISAFRKDFNLVRYNYVRHANNQLNTVNLWKHTEI